MKAIIVVCTVTLLAAFTSSGEVRIVPTLNSPIDGTVNSAYCPTLCTVWNHIKNIAGGPVEMSNAPPVLAELNKAQCPANCIPKNAYVSLAGFITNNIIDRIKKELQTKFGRDAPDLPSALRETTSPFIGYAYVQRTLQFRRQFNVFRFPLEFDSGKTVTQVKCFGTHRDDSYNYTKYVNVHYYSHSNEFSVLLKTRTDDEYILLSMLPAPRTFSDALKRITSQYTKIKEKKGLEREGRYFIERSRSLMLNDRLYIPMIDVHVEKNFDELTHKPFNNSHLFDLQLGSLFQSITFKMNENGAAIRSTATFDLFGEPKPFDLIFDKPFLISVWKAKAEQPYLAIWVASPDIMNAFPQEKNDKK